MTTKAIILIETAVGTSRDVANGLRGVAGVQSADVVIGPYDVITVVETEDLRGVGSLVEQHIHTLTGVIRTITCISTS